MTHKRKTTIWTTLQAVDTLQKLAFSLGYIQDRGPLKGKGSISAMVEALSNGQLVITRKESQ